VRRVFRAKRGDGTRLVFAETQALCYSCAQSERDTVSRSAPIGSPPRALCRALCAKAAATVTHGGSFRHQERRRSYGSGRSRCVAASKSMNEFIGTFSLIPQEGVRAELVFVDSS